MEQLKYKIVRQVLYIGATQLAALSSNILDKPSGFSPSGSFLRDIYSRCERKSSAEFSTVRVFGPVYDLVSF